MHLDAAEALDPGVGVSGREREASSQEQAERPEEYRGAVKRTRSHVGPPNAVEWMTSRA